MFTRILVPIDGSEHATRAVDIAGSLTGQDGVQLTLLHVLTHAGGYSVPKELQAYAKVEHIRVTEKDLIESVGREILGNAAQRLRDQGVRRG